MTATFSALFEHGRVSTQTIAARLNSRGTDEGCECMLRARAFGPAILALGTGALCAPWLISRDIAVVGIDHSPALTTLPDS
jgi:hypothetical protein